MFGMPLNSIPPLGASHKLADNEFAYLTKIDILLLSAVNTKVGKPPVWTAFSYTARHLRQVDSVSALGGPTLEFRSRPGVRKQQEMVARDNLRTVIPRASSWQKCARPGGRGCGPTVLDQTRSGFLSSIVQGARARRVALGYDGSSLGSDSPQSLVCRKELTARRWTREPLPLGHAHEPNTDRSTDRSLPDPFAGVFGSQLSISG